MFDKKRANQGASVIMALVFFLIVSLVSVLVIGLASMNVERNQHQIEQEQDQLTLSSALQQVRWWFMDSFTYETSLGADGVQVCDWIRSGYPLVLDRYPIAFPYCSDPSLDRWLRQQSYNVLTSNPTTPLDITVTAQSNMGFAEGKALSDVTVELTMDDEFNVEVKASLKNAKSSKYDDKSCLTTMINCDVVQNQYGNAITSIMWCPGGATSASGPTIRDVLGYANYCHDYYGNLIENPGSRYVHMYASKKDAVAPNEQEIASSYAWGRTLNSLENNTEVTDLNPRNDYRWTYALNPDYLIWFDNNTYTYPILPDTKMCVDWNGENENEIPNARLALIWHNGHYYYPALLNPEDNLAPQRHNFLLDSITNNQPYDFTGDGDYLVWRRAA